MESFDRFDETKLPSQDAFFSKFVLELSKLHMYDFHYNHMCVKRPRADQLRLLFTDTDCLAYDVQTDDIYRDMVDMLRVDMTLAIILSTILFMIHLIVKHLDSLKMN